MNVEDINDNKEFTLEDHIKERETSGYPFSSARTRHRDRFDYTKKLIEARLAHNLTQMGLANALGTTRYAVARLESGKLFSSTETLRRLAKVLEIEICISPQKLEIKPFISTSKETL